MAAPKGNSYSKNGPKPIDWELFEQLCGLQCTQSEIASMLKMHDDTLKKRAEEKYEKEYSEIYKIYSESGKCSLRRNQFVLTKKNATMGIWLGKQWLEQKEPESDLNKTNQPPREEVLQLQDENIRLRQQLKELKEVLQLTIPPNVPQS